MPGLKRTLIATAAAATLLSAGAPAAQAQEDVCVTYDFTGRQLCVLETAGGGQATAWGVIRENDVCPVIDFTGRRFCLVGDTIGYGG